MAMQNGSVDLEGVKVKWKEIILFEIFKIVTEIGLAISVRRPRQILSGVDGGGRGQGWMED